MSNASFTVVTKSNSKTAALVNSGTNTIFSNIKQYRYYNDHALKAIIHLFFYKHVNQLLKYQEKKINLNLLYLNPQECSIPCSRAPAAY